MPHLMSRRSAQVVRCERAAWQGTGVEGAAVEPEIVRVESVGVRVGGCGEVVVIVVEHIDVEEVEGAVAADAEGLVKSQFVLVACPCFMPCSGDTFHIEMNTARSIVLIQDLQLSSKGG